MRHEIKFPWFTFAVAALAVAASLPARANMIITVGSANVFQGGTSSLDVTITNTGLSTQNIATFSFEVSVPGGSGITFTHVNQSTAQTYIFFGDSFDVIFNSDPTISDGTAHPGPGAIIDGNDSSNSTLGTDVAAGATLGLGHVLFGASVSAPLGPVTVTLITTGCPSACGPTGLTDTNAANVAFIGVNGIITVQAPVGVPEPSTLLLAILTLPAIAVARRRLRRSSAPRPLRDHRCG